MRLSIIGGGQIGTSVARAAARSGKYRDISISEPDDDARKVLKELLAQDPATKRIEVTDSNKKAANRADIVVLATPIDQFAPVTHEIADSLKSGVAITDVGSIKQQSAAAILDNLPKGMAGRYVPAHPTVGDEGSGPKTSKPDMFDGGTIIVDTSTADASAATAITQLWEDVGGKPLGLTAGQHDKLYGTTSHLQHLVAFAATRALPSESTKLSEDQRSLYQMTRIADANKEMWLPIFEGNKSAIVESGAAYMDRLTSIKQALQSGDREGLTAILTKAHDFAKGFQAPEDDAVLVAARDTMRAPSDKAGDGLGLPMVLANVTALNAQRVEGEIKQPLAPLANRSLKEASRLTQLPPAQSADFLLANRGAVLKAISGFEVGFANNLSSVIQSDPTAQTAMITEARQKRRGVTLPDRPVIVADNKPVARDVPQAKPRYGNHSA
ncbi:MAG: hypothetical protein CL559_03130 [Alphaproteobacteria bacterium]|nr:hypothetical protein [Alphaproteobacteria bacterium]